MEIGRPCRHGAGVSNVPILPLAFICAAGAPIAEPGMHPDADIGLLWGYWRRLVSLGLSLKLANLTLPDGM